MTLTRWGWLSGADVLELEALGQVEVHLEGRQLPAAADGVLDVDVDLGAVEGAAALVDGVLQLLLLEGRAQGLGGLVPLVVAAHGLALGLGGEAGREVVEAEGPQDRDDEVEQADQLVLDLVPRAEDVAVVLGEAPDAHEAVEDPGTLVAVDRAQLEEPQGQLAVAALAGCGRSACGTGSSWASGSTTRSPAPWAGTWRPRTSRGGRWSPTASSGRCWASRRTRSRRAGGARGCSPPSACGRGRPSGARRPARRPARRGTTAGPARRPACGGPGPWPARGGRGGPPRPAWTPRPCRRCAGASGCARRPASRRRRPASA